MGDETVHASPETKPAEGAGISSSGLKGSGDVTGIGDTGVSMNGSRAIMVWAAPAGSKKEGDEFGLSSDCAGLRCKVSMGGASKGLTMLE